MKKIATFLTSIISLFALFFSVSTTAFAYTADETVEYYIGDYSYTLDNQGNATLTRYSGDADSLLIPMDIDGHTVICIGSQSFRFCDSLLEITIPDSVTCIDCLAFQCCDNLKKITIPDSVTKIGDSAFEGCLSLSEISIPDSVISIGAYAFDSECLIEIYIPSSVVEIGEQAFTLCNNLAKINVSPDNNYYETIDNVLFEKENKTLVCYPRGLHQSAYAIPSGTQHIGFEAFGLIDSLVEITIPDTVIAIDDRAFLYCRSLSEISIPDSVVNIGNQTFFGCESLGEITISDNVTSIGYAAFEECPALKIVTSQESYATQYCKENGINYQYPDSNDWLLN